VPVGERLSGNAQERYSMILIARFTHTALASTRLKGVRILLRIVQKPPMAGGSRLSEAMKSKMRGKVAGKLRSTL